MNIFEKSKWIWLPSGECDDQYAEFFDTVTYVGGPMSVRLSADSDYTLFVNGTYAASGQYGDFEHYKIYDTIDITPFLRDGENSLTFLVYHCGTGTSRYAPAKAGLIYEIASASGIAGFSSETTQCRQSPFYQSGFCVLVSTQLGYTFSYDANGDPDTPTVPAACVNKHCTFYPRPIKKSAVLPRKEPASVTRRSDTHYLIDLGGEVVGLPHLAFDTAAAQKITVAWGEHINDGGVRRVIAYRHFYFEYHAHAGHNVFTEYMLRLGCRYVEIFSEAPITLHYGGVLPQVYETEELPCEIADPLDRRIYDICVNTLKLCMMEHYVDCPWREQALYAFDSRNQMLFGYDAFRGGNAAYARANLKLIGMDRRSDGLLSITHPCGIGLLIPSFSLHYIRAVWEYTDFSGDTTLAAEVFAKLTEILETFVSHRADGLIPVIRHPDYWNFYDWSPHADRGRNTDATPDLFFNALFVLALRSYESICRALDRESPFEALCSEILAGIRSAFLRENSLFAVQTDEDAYTELGNALAVLAGAASGEEARHICDVIASGAMISCSLSNRIFVYQALLETDAQKYRDAILTDIRTRYQAMLDFGSDTVWETEAGDNGKAGSLCHGWSAIPVYVWHKLGIAVR